MVMPIMSGGAPMSGAPMNDPSGAGDIDQVLISKVISLPVQLKQTLLEIITKMEAPTSSASPVSPGLEGNLSAMNGGGM